MNNAPNAKPAQTLRTCVAPETPDATDRDFSLNVIAALSEAAADRCELAGDRLMMADSRKLRAAFKGLARALYANGYCPEQIALLAAQAADPHANVTDVTLNRQK